MRQKYIQLLQEQLDKLDAPQFDLEAWKSATMAILMRIFGKEDEKARFIKNIRVEFGSWSLRDNYGSTNPMGTAIKQGKEILNSAIRELELFGLPGEAEPTGTVQDLLSDKQQTALEEILKLDTPEKEAQLESLLADWKPTLIRKLLAFVLLKQQDI